MKKLFTKRLICTLIALVLLASSSTAFARHPAQERSPEECKAIRAYVESLAVLVNDMLKEATKSERQNSLISNLLTHETSFRNSWVVSDGYRSKMAAIESSIEPHMGALEDVVLTRENSVRTHFQKTDKLFDSSLEIDLGEPDDEERAKAMVTLRELSNEIFAQCVVLKDSFYASNFGEVALLNEQQQTTLYVQWLRFQKQLRVLKPVVARDQSRVSAGSMDLESLTHYDVSGRNHWALARKYKAVMADIATRIHDAYKPLYAKGVEPNRKDQMEALKKLGGKIEWDLGRAEEDDAYNATEKTKALIEQGLGNCKEFDAGFTDNVENSSEIIAAAQKQFETGAAADDVTPDGDDSSDEQQAEEPAVVDGVNLIGVGADTAEDANNGSTQQTSNVAVPSTSYTIQSGDTLGAIANGLKAQFLAAGWKEEDIPPLWGGNGLVEAIANNNNMSDINQPIHADTELNIPSVPKPSADGNGEEAFQSWAATMGQEGAVSQPVTDVSGSNPSTSQSNAMTAERIQTELSSFMGEYFPAQSTPDGMYKHLVSKPAGNKIGPATNLGLLVWSIDVTMKSIAQLAKQSNGKLDARTYKVGQAALNLKASLKAVENSKRTTDAQMKLILQRYTAYRATLGM